MSAATSLLFFGYDHVIDAASNDQSSAKPHHEGWVRRCIEDASTNDDADKSLESEDEV